MTWYDDLGLGIFIIWFTHFIFWDRSIFWDTFVFWDRSTLFGEISFAHLDPNNLLGKIVQPKIHDWIEDISEQQISNLATDSQSD